MLGTLACSASLCIGSVCHAYVQQSVYLQDATLLRTGTVLTCALTGAQLAVEAFGAAVDYAQLPGLWRLIFTTAPDVVRPARHLRCSLRDLRASRVLQRGLAAQAPLLQVSRPSPLPLWPPFTVGNIYQRFSPEAEGVVENIIQLSVPGLLEGALSGGPCESSPAPIAQLGHKQEELLRPA